jgi:hypothetical protein
MSPTEREYLDRHGPVDHAKVARIIELHMRYRSLVPLWLCDCDEGHCCVAHRAADHYAVRKKPERLARFLRLVERWRAGR